MCFIFYNKINIYKRVTICSSFLWNIFIDKNATRITRFSWIFSATLVQDATNKSCFHWFVVSLARLTCLSKLRRRVMLDTLSNLYPNFAFRKNMVWFAEITLYQTSNERTDVASKSLRFNHSSIYLYVCYRCDSKQSYFYLYGNETY